MKGKREYVTTEEEEWEADLQAIEMREKALMFIPQNFCLKRIAKPFVKIYTTAVKKLYGVGLGTKASSKHTTRIFILLWRIKIQIPVGYRIPLAVNLLQGREEVQVGRQADPPRFCSRQQSSFPASVALLPSFPPSPSATYKHFIGIKIAFRGLVQIQSSFLLNDFSASGPDCLRAGSFSAFLPLEFTSIPAIEWWQGELENDSVRTTIA
ncbi:hypothetical protein AVEN_191219-1 [Araneus ventricosus]|uniref:Uncharacterized protein n=1 Tax=Araneus ventricosus TaxID=182803 RepID=A0A4Y2TZZ7_ARAVE|nr:hypothetical protein AVEN_191219-1 [Araneus ventricosus]